MSRSAFAICALGLSACFIAAAQVPSDTPPEVENPAADTQSPAPLPAADTGAPFFVATNWYARFEEYGRRLFSVQAVVQTAPIALWDQVTNFPHKWGRGGEGMGERLGSQYGQFFLDQTIQLALWGVHREDSHYFRSGEGNFFKRTGHVLKGTVIVSNTRGGQTLAIGAIAGSYGSWAIATQLWEPRAEQNAQQIMMWGSAGLIGKAAGNFAREFWPDAKRKLFTHGKANPLATWSKAAAR